MVAGIGFQLFTMTVFALLAVNFVTRSIKLGIPQLYYAILGAMFISLLAIYIRSIYRTLELTGGWNGTLIRDQPLFIGLDAVLMVVAAAVFLVVNPFGVRVHIGKVPAAELEKGASDREGRQTQKVLGR